MDQPNKGKQTNVYYNTRPGCITAFVFGVSIGIVIALYVLLSSDVIQSFHPTAPVVVLLWILMATLMAMGFWRMKEWAFGIFALLILLANVVYPLIIQKFGLLNILILLVQLFLIGVLWMYKRQNGLNFFVS